VTGSITVVGLGPAGAELLTGEVRHALAAHHRRFARTARHPAIDELAGFGTTFESFDHHYETHDSFDGVYAAIVDDLVAAAQTGDVLYAVPGSPLIAERTVELLLARSDVAVRILPGLSFVDLAAASVGIDPTRLTLVDAHAIDVTTANVGGAVLIVQVDSTAALSDAKLALLEVLDGDAPVTRLHHLGLPDEDVVRVPLAELDRGTTADHLTAVFADTGIARLGGELAELAAVTARLRAPGGCPWDRDQTHHSLSRHVIEEAYEVVEAIGELPAGAGAVIEPGETEVEVPAEAETHLEEELGDLLFQVVLHAQLASERGAFTLADVTRGVSEKLVHRHPHVFGEVEVANADEVLANWEANKRIEKGRASVLDGLDPALPSLLYAHKLVRKAAALDVVPELDVATEVEALAAAGPDEAEAALGRVLAALVLDARRRGIDAESALRGWSAALRVAVAEAEADNVSDL